MEDVKYIEDAEVISEGVNAEATTETSTQAEMQMQRQIEEWQEMYAKMHTPFKREYRKMGRNETCPYCDSGLKFKKCECYKTYGEQVNY